MVREGALDADALCDEARRRLSLDDFGPDDFRPGLEALVETYRRAPFSEAGLASKKRYLDRLLTTRLRAAHVVARFPEIERRAIESPIYIVGAARTGTTLLHRMLAEVPDVRTMARWEGLFPVPAIGSGDDSRARRGDAASEGRDPSFDAIREVKPDLPEEDYLLLEPAMRFASGGEDLWEPFRTYAAKADQRPSYEYLALLVRILDWQRSASRWLMKSPAHLGHLELLVEQFPDAVLVWTHRDPLESVASLCSLMDKAISRFVSVDRVELGGHFAVGVESQLASAMDTRQRLGEDRFIDVDYRDLLGSPVSTAMAVATRAGVGGDPVLAVRLKQYATDHPQNAHGMHTYDLADYGLDPDDLRERFSPYTSHFSLGPSAR